MLMGVAVLAVAGVACSDGDDDAASATTVVDGTVDTTAVTTSTAVDETVPPTTDTEPAATTVPPTTLPPTVPEDGVPGIDSDDAFCRAWSEFAGSFQALSLTASFGDPGTAVRLEVAASGAVTAAVATLADELPAEIEDERDEFLDGLIGPFARRAARAVAELEAAGATPAQIEALGDTWLDALVEAGTDDPAITLVVADDLAGPLDAAVAVVAANVPPIPADPSLITDAEPSATLAYVADNCPDQGILAGNDIVDG